jgi:hypothetical protein
MNNKIKKTHAQILFDCDRTCCICHDRTRKHVQVHHIDGNNGNDSYQNLAVLCLECHNDTMLKGGFGRKLSPTEVIMYRNDWISQIKRLRSAGIAKIHRPLLVIDPSHGPSQAFLAQLYENNILPQGLSYEFVAFSFTMHGMLHIITDCDDINPKNAYDREGVLAAYLLCGLGAILPAGFVVTDTPTPNNYTKPMLNHRPMRKGPIIRIPRWIIRGAEDIGVLMLTVDYEHVTNQVFVNFHPLLMEKNRLSGIDGNYTVLDRKLTQIGQALVGKSLAL